VPVEVYAVKPTQRTVTRPSERTWLLYSVAHRQRDLSKSTLIRIARFNLAFRAYKTISTLVIAIDELSSLLRESIEEKDETQERLPQVPMLLKRSLFLYLTENKDWSGLWSAKEPTVDELRALLRTFFHSEEPWLRQFFLSSLDLLQFGDSAKRISTGR